MITAVLAGQSQSEVARTYGVSQGWISRLMARYRREGRAAFEPASRAPKTSPGATAPATVEVVLRLRKELLEAGLDAGADTIGWHLTHHHRTRVSRATIHRILVRAGAVTPEPRNIIQKNGQPNHPQTQGKVERFQQTLKKWLRAQPAQPSTLTALQALLDAFAEEYNHRRPHRSLPHSSTPAAAYTARPKAAPDIDRAGDTHDRVRLDKVSKNGSVTLRVAGRLRHIGIGRTHAGTDIILLVHDLSVRVVNAATGELLRELIIDPRRDYQPTGRPPGPTPNTQ